MDKSIPIQADLELRHMVVLPALQGSGLGSKCLQHVMECARAQVAPGAPCVVRLSTQKRINVAFYARNGFALVSQDESNFEGHICPNFYMSRHL